MRAASRHAVTISAMSVLLSVYASFYTGLYYGGPAVMVWGWIGVSLCCICIALGMAELVGGPGRPCMCHRPASSSVRCTYACGVRKGFCSQVVFTVCGTL